MQSLKKSRKVLNQVYSLYKRKKNKLSQELQNDFESRLHALNEALQTKDKEKAGSLAHELVAFSKKYLPKTFFDQIYDFIGAVVFALVIAICIRQMWFEFYMIPSGSMRPTFKEWDFLVVSKTTYGINTPLRTSHLYFDPKLVKRGDVVVFTGDGMDIDDVDTMYFYIIPGKKQFIKRMIGKPGDTLYFYGGWIYGIDRDGNAIEEFRSPWLETIEHIPFIRFDGRVSYAYAREMHGAYSPIVLSQMNEAIAKMYIAQNGNLYGQMLPQEYKKEAPVKNYYDLWGFKNFGMSRLLTRSQALQYTKNFPDQLNPAPLYLEIFHHPSLHPPILKTDMFHRMRPSLKLSSSIIPLQPKHIQELREHLYTGRFIVKNQKAARYGFPIDHPQYQRTLPNLKNVPDGTYEFDNGIAYKVHLGGVLTKLPEDHPLNNPSDEWTQFLYNLGIEFDTRFVPHSKDPIFIPSRYVYFRNGELYTMGSPIFSKDDSILEQFVHKQSFIDYGPPLSKDGTLNKDFILQYGIKIPDEMYLVLGDNHAMSGDSREFGFLPQENIRGSASFIFWPFGNRWGLPYQPSKAILTFPNVAIWSIALIIAILAYLYYRKKRNSRLKF